MSKHRDAMEMIPRKLKPTHADNKHSLSRSLRRESLIRVIYRETAERFHCIELNIQRKK